MIDKRSHFVQRCVAALSALLICAKRGISIPILQAVVRSFFVLFFRCLLVFAAQLINMRMCVLYIGGKGGMVDTKGTPVTQSDHVICTSEVVCSKYGPFGQFCKEQHPNRED